MIFESAQKCQLSKGLFLKHFSPQFQSPEDNCTHSIALLTFPFILLRSTISIFPPAHIPQLHLLPHIINALIFYLQLLQSLFTNNLSTSSKTGSKGIPPKYPPILRGLLILLFTLFFLAISFYLHKISVLQFSPADVNVRATMAGMQHSPSKERLRNHSLLCLQVRYLLGRPTAVPPNTCGEVTERLEQGCVQLCALG